MPSESTTQAKLRAHVYRAARIAFITVYVIVAAEIFLRFLAPQALMPRYVCAGENGIRANKPNSNYWHSAPSFRVNMRINAKGVRSDRDIPYDKPEGVKRIVVLGDSYGMGYGVDVEDTFAMVLERSLNAAGATCEVINLSVSGFGSAEELVMLTTEGFKYSPDLAVIQFNSSDPRETMASGLFELDNGQLVPAAPTYLPAVAMQDFLFRFAVYRFLSDHSQLYVLARERAAEFVKRRVVPGIRMLAPKSGPREAVMAPRPATTDDGESYNNRLTLAVLEAARDACRKRGIGFMIVDIPADRGLYEYTRNDFWNWSGAGTSGLSVYYAADDFQAHRGQQLFDPWSNSHLTPLGNRIAGEGLARFIADRQLPPF